MKYLDEYRDGETARRLVSAIRSTATRRWVLMDVCGGQTHGLLRSGIEAALNDAVELIHGPGCPVCVTPVEAIDFAQRLAMRPDVMVTSFGDMLRVPGSRRSLLESRAEGGSIQTVYSPSDAVELAQKHPDRQIVFFAVGFETTVPATAVAVLQAEALGLSNFSLLVSHVRVLPAMEALLSAADNRVDGFLAAGHVCTVTGVEDYGPLVDRFRVPVAVTGFEPVDLLQGILEVVSQLESGRAEVCNCYARSVRSEGNVAARQVIEEVYEITDQRWRGLGPIRQGGFRLRERFAGFDAARKFGVAADVAERPGASNGENGRGSLPMVGEETCRSGEVLAGRIKPPDCPAFAGRCRPESPLGAPMVSSEGACAAYYRYHAGRGA